MKNGLYPDILDDKINCASRHAKLSVIIPCFNSLGTIGRAIDSVFQQTMLPAEIIVVDDKSTDDTVSHLRALQDRCPAKFIKIIALDKNVGAGSARNRGWESANNPYIAFLDSDDAWHPKKIEYQYKWMQQNQDVYLTGHGFKQAQATQEGALAAPLSSGFHAVSSRSLLFKNCFPTPSVMLKRDIPFRFKENKRYSEDYLLWLEICLSGYGCYRSSDVLAYSFKSDYGEGGLSASLWKMEKGELDAYSVIWEKGLTNRLSKIGLQLWSLAKYLKRLAKF